MGQHEAIGTDQHAIAGALGCRVFRAVKASPGMSGPDAEPRRSALHRDRSRNPRASAARRLAPFHSLADGIALLPVRSPQYRRSCGSLKAPLTRENIGNTWHLVQM